MSKLIVFRFNAAGSTTWVADQDYDLVTAYISNGNACLVTTDPTLSVGSLSSPSVKDQLTSVVFFQNTQAASPMGNARVRIDSGTSLLITVSAALSCFLYLEPVTVS
jgi:hypothetical protein